MDSVSYPQLILKILTLTWILVGSPDAVSSQLSTMDISAGEIVCPGKEVLFTCVSRGTGIITWTSAEYIGNQIDFNTRDTPNETRLSSVDPNTIATFINSSIEEGTIPVLVSTLQITVLSVSLTPSVTCIHSRSENFTFQVLDVPPGVLQINAEYAMRMCALNISWTPPDNVALSDITHFTIYANGSNVRNVTDITNTMYPVNSCTFHNVSVSIVDRCGREGPSRSTTVNPEPFCDDTACTNNSGNSPVSGLGPVWTFLAITVAILVAMGSTCIN